MDYLIQIHKPLNSRHCIPIVQMGKLGLTESNLPKIWQVTDQGLELQSGVLQDPGPATLLHCRGCCLSAESLNEVICMSFYSHWIYALLPGLAISLPCAWFGRIYVFFNVAVVHCFPL